MTAAFYLGSGTIEARPAPPRDPGPHEVAIDVAFTGICGTDLHILHGAMDGRVRVPAVLGHEMSGRIAVLGEQVTGWSVGQPVTVLPVVSCGHCPACRAGHANVCHQLDFVGIDSPGAMQSRWVVPTQLLVALPPGLPLEHAALVEPTAVAVHDVRRGAVQAGQHVVVVGGGPIGLLIAVLARREGAAVLLVETDPFRRSVASGLALDVADPGSADIGALVERRSGGTGADVVFEVSGAAEGVATAVASLRTRGRLVLVAIHPQPRPLDLHRFFWRELELVGARLYGRDDVERAVELVADGTIPVAALISRVVPLAGAAAAFGALEAGGVVKVLVDCRGEERA